MSWLAAQEKKLAKLLIDTENETYYQKYKVSCISYLTTAVKRSSVSGNIFIFIA